MSMPVMLMIVARTLFRKCTLIGTKILSVFKYKIHMQIPKINALVIPPNSCPIPNINEEIIIAGIIPVLIFSLLNKIPLKTSSSSNGAKIIVIIESRIMMPDSASIESISHMEIHVGSVNPIIISKNETKNVNRNANSKLMIKM